MSTFKFQDGQEIFLYLSMLIKSQSPRLFKEYFDRVP